MTESGPRRVSGAQSALDVGTELLTVPDSSEASRFAKSGGPVLGGRFLFAFCEPDVRLLLFRDLGLYSPVTFFTQFLENSGNFHSFCASTVL
jgi:hypothetical protein